MNRQVTDPVTGKGTDTGTVQSREPSHPRQSAQSKDGSDSTRLEFDLTRPFFLPT